MPSNQSNKYEKRSMRMRWLLRGERQKLNKNLKRKNSFEINIDCPCPTSATR